MRWGVCVQQFLTTVSWKSRKFIEMPLSWYQKQPKYLTLLDSVKAGSHWPQMFPEFLLTDAIDVRLSIMPLKSNKFCLKFYFFVIKQSNINKIFQNFTGKAPLTYHVCSFAWMASPTLMQFNDSKILNFLSSWEMAKNTIK